jgi:hypothetical protein
MPFHGEAPRRDWRLERRPETAAGRITAEMACDLPMAGLKVAREIRLGEAESVLTVVERVTNANKLGRVYNIVQHPTIAPPFLGEGTRIDSNAGYGFGQTASVPASRAAASLWPNVASDGKAVDLRYLKAPGGEATQSDVSSFVFDESAEYGWVTASSPHAGLLIGYLWRTRDYPWLNVWRHVLKGRVAARGLEFGTTGYHQPFPVLVRTGRILDRPLYEYLDAGQTTRKAYAAFLLAIPQDFKGVSAVTLEKGRIVVLEEGPRPRTLGVRAATLSLD